MSPQDNKHEDSSNVPEHIKQPSQIVNNTLPGTQPQTTSLDQLKPQKKKIRKMVKIFVAIILVVLGLISIIIIINKLSTDSGHNKLLKEVSSLNLSSSKPQIIGFDNEPTNPELLISDTYPGVHLTLSITQTTLGNEINNLKSVLQSRQFTIAYDSTNTPFDIIGTSKNYFINIGLEFNNSQPPLVNTGQKSSFNGEPIFAEPGAKTIVNDIQINLEDTSKLNTGL